MKRNKIHTFLFRIAFVFTAHILIKAGDFTLDIFEISIRSMSFSSYFISYWLFIWYISAYINTKIKNYKNKHVSSYLLFSFNFAISVMAALFANYLYRMGDVHLFNNTDAWKNISIINPELSISLMVMYLMVFFFDIYFISVVNSKEDQIQLEKLKQENTLAKYLNLKSQVEPHFLFNSLSVLSSIIHTNTDLASEFLLRLSKILRYVIERNEQLTVPLKDEIKFINDYFFLIKTRFEKGIIIENNIEENIIKSTNIPPVSLQLLVENAIKHNKFTDTTPLHIQLYNNNNYLIVKNNLDERNDVTYSTKQGLDNLTKRFSFLSGKPVKIEMTETEFIIHLPILLNQSNESFNI